MPHAFVLSVLEREGGEPKDPSGFRGGRCQGLHPRPGPGHPPLCIFCVLVVFNHPFPSVRHHEATRHAIGTKEVSGDVMLRARHCALRSKGTHLGAGNANEIIHAIGVGYLHGVVPYVIHDLGEREHLHPADARRHLEDITTVVTIIKVVVFVSHGLHRPLQSSRITSHDEVAGAGTPPALGVELHLRGPRVDHGRGPDGHNRGGGIQSTRMACPRPEDLLVLAHSHV
mmetsp:Transcript_32886/g.75684  ORF Transcript_32886/g.75684 Transcript_32886/m.75684 type:complete len:228 (-) Transcript_32886:1858-2541(-)